MTELYSKTRWHLLLGRLLQLALEPVQVEVLVEVPLLADAPKADIILIRRHGEQWTTEQRRWLADGLRHANAAHLLVEFKYSEGLSLTALQQLNAYDYFYRIGKNYAAADVACFLIVASTPQGEWYRDLGFSKTEWSGVYHGTGPFAERVQVLLLNELAPTPHNAPLKCFASRIKERTTAFQLVQNSGFESLSMTIELLIRGLRNIFMPTTQLDELTPEKVMEIGQEWIDSVLRVLPIDEVLRHYKSDEVLRHYKPDEVLGIFKPEQRLSGLSEEQIRAYLEQLQASKH